MSTPLSKAASSSSAAGTRVAPSDCRAGADAALTQPASAVNPVSAKAAVPCASLYSIMLMGSANMASPRADAAPIIQEMRMSSDKRKPASRNCPDCLAATKPGTKAAEAAPAAIITN
ncbi:hypothetical protein D3C78_1663720 [compost metagenome]